MHICATLPRSPSRDIREQRAPVMLCRTRRLRAKEDVLAFSEGPSSNLARVARVHAAERHHTENRNRLEKRSREPNMQTPRTLSKTGKY